MDKIDFTRMTADELLGFWEDHHLVSEASRLKIYGRLDRGSKRATKAAASYAYQLAMAKRSAANGDKTGEATRLLICESLRSALPDTIIA